jgi:hypothetical protein
MLAQEVAQVKGRLELRGIDPARVDVKGYAGAGGWLAIVITPSMVTPLALDLLSVALRETHQPGDIGRTETSVVVLIGPGAQPGVASTPEAEALRARVAESQITDSDGV